jgi:hypothetical protein
MKKLILASAIAGALAMPSLHAETGNWKASLIVEGVYYDSSRDVDDHEEGHDDHDDDHEEEHEEEDHEEHNHGGIAGFPQGAHDHGFEEGLQAGHIEAVLTGNITDSLHSRFTLGLTETEEEGIEAEIEEAFVETQGLGNGLGIKAGRFFSDIGYLSSKHNHEWDFADNALVYKNLFGAHTYDDGIQFTYVAPTDTFIQIGTELLRGDDFPAADSGKTIGAATVFAKVGGDIGTDHSWLAGIGQWRANGIEGRKGEAHYHDDERITPSFNIDSTINVANVTYKWAPNGNPKERNFKFQAEYLQRDESGTLNMLEDDGHVHNAFAYDGKQSGWYMQGVYQFMPHWRAGLRYEKLDSDNTLAGASEHAYEASNLHDGGISPKRTSLMFDYSPREYSRLRLQFNKDETTAEEDNQIILQYVHSFGSHGAHAF